MGEDFKEDVEVEINCNEKNGTCEKYYFLANERDPSKKQLKVIHDYINIRKDASSNSDIIGQVHKGDIYTILDQKEWSSYSWYQIRMSNGKIGWIAGNYDNEAYVEILEKE